MSWNSSSSVRTQGGFAMVLMLLSASFTFAQVNVLSQDSPLRPETQASFNLPTPKIVTAARLPGKEEHPLVPAIKLAISDYKHVRTQIKDYSCVVVRRERNDGQLGDHEYIFAKVRHRRTSQGKVVVPFSVYMKFLKPTAVAGREVLFVEGQNDGEMLVRRGGPKFGFIKVRLKPDSEVAMNGNRYPITEFGIENLLRRLIEVSKDDLQTECSVQFLNDAKINKRPCTGIEVSHPIKLENARFQTARIFLDHELNIPVHYEAFGWADDGGEPLLLEQYTYTNVKLNNGFSDSDFDPTNSAYDLK